MTPASDLAWDEACGASRVPKDSGFDRLILNPTVVNSRCASISASTQRLGQGFLLCRLGLEPGEWLAVSCDDLREFYYTFRVPTARARRNALRVRLPAARFKAFKPGGPSSRAWTSHPA